MIDIIPILRDCHFLFDYLIEEEDLRIIFSSVFERSNVSYFSTFDSFEEMVDVESLFI